jgi:UDP-N-acetylglucosamine/UDP-N-acetylgalactosamine diphosphorylase
VSDLFSHLRVCGQEHVLRYWDELSRELQNQLAQQIGSVNVDELAKLFACRHELANWQELAARAVSPTAFRLDDPQPRFAKTDAIARGEAALRGGKIGAILVAGGQGTRLGFDHPKGMFPAGPISQRTLFQIFADQLRARGRRYGVRIPLLLMTSPATHDETVAYFEEHNFLGLKRSDVTIFCQGTMPAIDAETGKLLLADRHALALSPDGHGGTLGALVRHGCLQQLRERGIEQLYYFQVDNPLVEIADPALIGYHLLSGSEMSTAVVAKQDPSEKVGVLVEIDGQVRVLEYSDLPADAAARRTPDGSLALWAGNTAVHVFERSFLERVESQADALPFHLARKAVPYVNEAGELVGPTAPNAIKFERFIFDLLPHAKNAIVVEIDPAEGFAPIKSADGAPRDTPQTARAAMVALHRRWLRAAGATVPDGVDVEISPLFALDIAELKRKLPAGLNVAAPRFFAGED